MSGPDASPPSGAGDHQVAERRLAVLNEASAMLAVSLDLDAVLQRAAKVTVPTVADWCFVDLIHDDGDARRVAAAHADPADEHLAEILLRYPLPTQHFARDALASGEPMLLGEPTEEMLERAAVDAEHLAALRELGSRSAICVPLVARGRTIGLLSLALTRSGRRFSPDDLPLAEAIARRAALAADNALLYQEIRDANARYRALVGSIEAIVWEADASPFRFRYISEQEERILGYPVERWMDDPDLAGSIIHDDDRPGVVEAFRRIIRTGETARLQYRARAADGRWVWLDAAVFADADESGTVVSLSGLTTDVSERKRLEMYERAQSAVDHVLAGGDPSSAVPARLIQAVCETIGWEVGTLWRQDPYGLGLRCEEFWSAPGTDVTVFRDATMGTVLAIRAGLPGRVWATGEPTWIVDAVDDPDFQRASQALAVGLHACVAFPIHEQGQLLGVVELFSAERREPDDRLLSLLGTMGAQIGQYLTRRRLEEAALDNEARTRAVVDAALDAVIMMDANGTAIEFNPAAEALFGYKRDDAIGKPVADLVVPHHYRERHRQGLARYLATGETSVLGRRMEITAMRADRREIPVELTVTRVDAPGAPSFAASIRDISGRIASESRRDAQYAVTRVLNEAPSLMEAAQKILETVSVGLGWNVGLMWLVEPSTDSMRPLASWAAWSDDFRPFLEVASRLRLRRGEGVAGRVWQARRALWFAEAALQRTLVAEKTAHAHGLRAAFAFPIPGRSATLGVLEFFSADARAPDADLLAMMETTGIQIGQFIERREIEEATRFQKALLESQADATIEGVVITSLDGRLLSSNRRFAEMFDVPGELLVRGDTEALMRFVFANVADPAAIGPLIDLLDDATSFERGEVSFADGRSFDRYTAPLRGDSGEVYGRAWYFRDITQRKRSEIELEAGNRRLTFLAEASTVLASSLDPGRTMRALARLLVPTIADLAIIEIRQDDGTLFRAGFHTQDDDQRSVLESRAERSTREVDPRAERGADAVIRTGRSECATEIPDEWLDAAAKGDPETLSLLREMGFCSYMCVPLVARDQILGVLTLVSTTSSRRYGPEDLTLAEDVARRAALAIDNARLYADSAHVARTLQDSLLPPELPQIPGAVVGAVYHSAARGVDVGGDFYDLFETGDDEWALVIGDVCGKGAPAAAITALARYTLRAAAMQARRPSRVLATLNEAIIRQHTDERFCTVAYARIGPAAPGESRSISIACGGHPSPMVLRTDGSVEAIGMPGSLLGVFDEPVLTEVTTVLEPGDAVILYTDGVIEARGTGGALDEQGLSELIGQCRDATPEQISQRIANAAIEVQGGSPRDDIAVVVLKTT